MLAALAQSQVVLSPTLFHNSVFDAPAGYWSIGSRCSCRLDDGQRRRGVACRRASRKRHGQVLLRTRLPLYIAYDARVSGGIGVVCAQRRAVRPARCAWHSVSATRGTGYGRLEQSPGDPGDRREQPVLLPAQLRERFSGNSAADVLPLLRYRKSLPRPHCASRSGRVAPQARLSAMIMDRTAIQAPIPAEGCHARSTAWEYWDGQRIICTSMQHRSAVNLVAYPAPASRRFTESNSRRRRWLRTGVASRRPGAGAAARRVVVERSRLRVPLSKASMTSRNPHHRGRANG